MGVGAEAELQKVVVLWKIALEVGGSASRRVLLVGAVVEG